MNRLHLRRAAVLTAGTLLGLAGVATVAGPAAAHHPEPSGSYCATPNGAVTVTWSVTSSETDISGRITKLVSTVPGPVERGPGGRRRAEAGREGHAHRHPDPHVLRPGPGAEAHRRGALGPGPQVARGRADRDGPPGPRLRDAEPVAVAQHAAERHPLAEHAAADHHPDAVGVRPAEPVHPAQLSAPPAEPIFKLDQDCDSMTFVVENPAAGAPFTATLTTEKGVTRTLASEPGKTSSVEFDAYPGLKVTVKYDVVEDAETIPYAQPDDCSGQGGGLPVTGPAAGAIAGGAALLLAAGAVLFVTARRRRIRFTA